MNNMMPYGQMYPEDMARDLTAMYPRTYNIIYPIVMEVCVRMDIDIQRMPTRQEVDRMADMVYDRVEAQVPDEEYEMGDMYPREPQEISQFGFFPRRRRRLILRDLISILLLRELFRRRRFF